MFIVLTEWVSKSRWPSHGHLEKLQWPPLYFKNGKTLSITNRFSQYRFLQCSTLQDLTNEHNANVLSKSEVPFTKMCVRCVKNVCEMCEKCVNH
jgi:hypothetical protein